MDYNSIENQADRGDETGSLGEREDERGVHAANFIKLSSALISPFVG
jgi:hypothetical protein